MNPKDFATTLRRIMKAEDAFALLFYGVLIGGQFIPPKKYSPVPYDVSFKLMNECVEDKTRIVSLDQCQQSKIDSWHFEHFPEEHK